jgi:hypothetical protein
MKPNFKCTIPNALFPKIPYLYRMQLEFKLKRILPVLFGLFFLWGTFILSEFLFAKKVNENALYIPVDADLVLKIDAKSFFQSAIYDVFLDDKDKEVFAQLQKMAQGDFDNSPFKDTGIDLLSDVIYFEKSISNGKISGFLFNLTDPKSFKARFSSSTAKNQYFNANENVGVVISTTSGISDKQARAFVLKALSQKNVNPKTFTSEAKEGQILSVSTSLKSPFGKGQMSVQLLSGQFILDGEFAVRKNLSQSNWTLKKDGFHLLCGIIPENYADTLQSLMNEEGFDLPKINRFSVNYRGTNIGENNILPDGDLLLSFESKLDKKAFVENQKPWQKLGFVVEASTENGLLLIRDDKAYTLRILDDFTLFFGSNTANLLQKKNIDLFLLEGDLTNLTEINGGGLMAVGLNFYPPYKASKTFFQSLSIAEIKFKSVNGKNKLTGKFEFKNEKTVVTEMLRFLLTLNN